MILLPPYLQKGDTIGITLPAGYMPREKAQTCINTLQQWGYEVMVGRTLGSDSNNYFSGTDEERADELQAMLDDSSIKAILCGRGGYGTSRIIDRLNFTRFKKNPKWIIGFSDITVLHCHLFGKLKMASLHALMAAAFNDGGFSNEFIGSLKKALAGKKNSYKATPHVFNRTGQATAILVGGNLSLLAHLTGTPSALDTRNKILFIEDIGEYIYSIDRMLHQLLRSGQLANLAGLVVGGFSDMKDTDRPFGKQVYDVIQEITAPFDYPVCYGFAVSHNKENYAIKVGATYTLQVSNRKVSLTEL